MTALHPDGLKKPTRSGACRFVCNDGRTYWVKPKGEHGLCAELLAARLGHNLGVTPEGKIVYVPQLAVDGYSDLSDFADKHLYGSADAKRSVNARDIEKLVGVGASFDPSLIRASDRAAVTVFQTWLGLSDEQVLVDLTSGGVMSIDHEEWDGEAANPNVRRVVQVSIPGVPGTAGRQQVHVMPSLNQVEAIGDDVIVDAASEMPSSAAWNVHGLRLWDIATTLAARRGAIRPHLEAWAV